MFRQPGDEKIEPTPDLLRPDVRAPFGPAIDELAEPQQADDLPVGRVLDQADGCLPPVETPECDLAAEESPELRFVQIVVPYEGQAGSTHGSSVHDPRACVTGALSAARS